MEGDSQWLRLRAIAASWFSILFVVLLVCTAAGGYATAVAYVDPGTTQQQQTVEWWSVAGDFDHSATVTRENPVFPIGTELTNRSTYFVGVSPILNGQFDVRYGPSANGPASVSLDATLVIRSVSDNGDTVFWADRTPLNQRTVTVAPGEAASIEFSLNATQVAQRRAAIQNSLGGSPGTVETFVAVDAAVEGPVNGEPSELAFTRRLSLSVSDGTYTVSESGTFRESATTTQMVSVPRTYGPLWRVGGPLLLILGLLGSSVLGLARRRGELALSETERELLEFSDDRSEFEEWIVRVDLPDAVLDRPHATADTLADLVDFAIDSDIGVVEDSDTGEFYAVTQDLLVVYEPPQQMEANADGTAALFDGLRSSDVEEPTEDTEEGDAAGDIEESS
ncbi:DUF5305 domain-containing protein [Halospeciosus flavus]|uniref:DUF5305 domain-containing protein n=1 Tax=Halospeciosus flavus TaxID=3032283 RepID=A0ABD5Z221_9EURY|nr:DUF5305 domain-containing protein [Halospeciosus flavus]